MFCWIFGWVGYLVGLVILLGWVSSEFCVVLDGGWRFGWDYIFGWVVEFIWLEICLCWTCARVLHFVKLEVLLGGIG